MHLLLTLPITLRSLVKPKKLEFNPAVMNGPLPSKSPDLWRRFLKPGGKTVAISVSDSAKVRAYMQEHSTEAISEDGLVAFTLQDDGFLVECLPDQLVEADAMALSGAVMQKARKAIYLMLREHGLDSRRAGHKARLICTERLSKQIGELFHHSTLLGRARFLGLQMEESLAKARNNRREALRFARYVHDGLTPHPRQFPQLREGVDGREVAAGFGDLARNYGAWARVHLMFAHRCSRNLNDLKSRNGLRVIP